MKFTFYLLMLICGVCHSYTPVGMASAAAIQGTQIANEVNNGQSLLISHQYIDKGFIGVMQCDAGWDGIPGYDNYDINSCRSKQGLISISDFFKKYRKSKNYEILHVIYDAHGSRFLIYYGITQKMDDSQ